MDVEKKYIIVGYDNDSHISVSLINKNGDHERSKYYLDMFECYKMTEELLQNNEITHINFEEYGVKEPFSENTFKVRERKNPNKDEEFTLSFTFNHMPLEGIEMSAKDRPEKYGTLYEMYEWIEHYRNQYKTLRVIFREGVPYEGSSNDEDILILPMKSRSRY